MLPPVLCIPKCSLEGYLNKCYPDCDLQVPFIHSGLDRDRKSGPTIVAIHGSPGTHRDFDNLIPAMDHMGANVIVPTFPGE